MKLLLKEWMELRNVSQAQIAAGLGVSRPTVSAWVEGRPKPGGGRIVQCLANQAASISPACKQVLAQFAAP